jgi:hypothetical protein
MVLWWYHGNVEMMISGCYQGVTKELAPPPMCYESVLRVGVTECYGVIMLLQGCYEGSRATTSGSVSSVNLRCYEGVMGVLWRCYEIVMVDS